MASPLEREARPRSAVPRQIAIYLGSAVRRERLVTARISSAAHADFLLVWSVLHCLPAPNPYHRTSFLAAPVVAPLFALSIVPLRGRATG
jgi:hypothetical protein